VKTVLIRTLSSIAVMLAAAISANGQTAYGSITGTVRDQSSAVMTGVRVTVANVGTNLSTTVQTSGDGNYTVVNLLPGEYRVTVQSPGFKKAVTSNLTLLVNQILRADVTLEPGAVETMVETRTRAPSARSSRTRRSSISLCRAGTSCNW